MTLINSLFNYVAVFILGLLTAMLILAYTGVDPTTAAACKVANDNKFGETACMMYYNNL